MYAIKVSHNGRRLKTLGKEDWVEEPISNRNSPMRDEEDLEDFLVLVLNEIIRFVIQPWFQVVQHFKNEIFVFHVTFVDSFVIFAKTVSKGVQEILEEIFIVDLLDDLIAQLWMQASIGVFEGFKRIVVPVELKEVFYLVD